MPGHWASNCPNSGAGGKMSGGKGKGNTFEAGYAPVPMQKGYGRGDGPAGPYGVF
jgi:hypothetical protein